MTRIDANNKLHDALNEEIWAAGSELTIDRCLGQRFIAAGARDKRVEINGVPGNALGAYLAGAEIFVNGNAQDATGDTMNDGLIVVNGSVGDAVGYAMRGGAIYVRDNAGYRAGIHMKEYKTKKPTIVIGGRAGSFLGEYQAGGLIVVLGLHEDGKPTIGSFPCAGMHGGKLCIRGSLADVEFPSQTTKRPIDAQDWDEIQPHVAKFCEFFGFNFDEVANAEFAIVTPNVANPYKQMYVAN